MRYKIFLVVMTMLILLLGTVQGAFAARIIAAYATPDKVKDLTWDGSYLWANIGPSVYKLDPLNGNLTNVYTTPWADPHGLEWDGSHFWIAVEALNTIFKLNPSDWSVISSFSVPNNPHGLTFDGTSLWVACTGTPNALYEINPLDGSIIRSLAAFGWGIAWDGEYFLTTKPANPNEIRRIDPVSGDIIEAIPGPGSYSTGVEWDGTYLWVADWGQNRIYKLDIKDTQGPVVDLHPDIFELEVVPGMEKEEDTEIVLDAFLEVPTGMNAGWFRLLLNETVLAEEAYREQIGQVLYVVFLLDLADISAILGVPVTEVEVDNEKIMVKSTEAPVTTLDCIELTVTDQNFLYLFDTVRMVTKE